MLVRRLNLLVVDDDPSLVRLITTVVQGSMSDQIVAVGLSDSEQARAWLDENCCDILLSDIEMPSIDGLELLRIAKRRNAWTQVIFMTAYSTWERISEALEMGAADYLIKPIDLDDLKVVLLQSYERFARWQTAAFGTLAAAEAV